MEPATISEINWSSSGSSEFLAFCAPSSQHEHQFSGFMSVEEAEIMAQLFANYPYTNELSVGEHCDLFPRSNFPWVDHETMNMAVDGDNSYHCSNTSNPSLYYWPPGNHLISLSDFEVLASNSAVKNGVPLMNSSVMNDFYVGVDQNDRNTCSEIHAAPNNPWKDADGQNKAMSADESKELCAVNPFETVLPDEKLQPESKLESLESVGIMPMEEKVQSEVSLMKHGDRDYLANSDMTQHDYLPENTHKKARVSGDVQRTGRNVQSKKNQKLVRTDEAEENTGFNGQSSSSYCSEDDSIASQELNGTTSSSKGSPALNINGKTRAGRGSATDPQSLYARRRRERINERLRILQTLIPNGTKVDISTMLEEAVQYVKFLQLQIKLLSSDDLWMYVPIAYNGMDIGFDLKISPPSGSVH